MGKKSGGKPFTPADKVRIMRKHARDHGGEVRPGTFPAVVQHLVDTGSNPNPAPLPPKGK